MSTNQLYRMKHRRVTVRTASLDEYQTRGGWGWLFDEVLFLMAEAKADLNGVRVTDTCQFWIPNINASKAEIRHSVRGMVSFWFDHKEYAAIGTKEASNNCWSDLAIAATHQYCDKVNEQRAEAIAKAERDRQDPDQLARIFMHRSSHEGGPLAQLDAAIARGDIPTTMRPDVMEAFKRYAARQAAR